MKELMNTMEKDFMKENFTKSEMFIYGFVYPMVFIALLAIVAMLDAMIASSLN